MFNGLKYRAALPLTPGNAEVLDIKLDIYFHSLKRCKSKNFTIRAKNIKQLFFIKFIN